MKIAELRLHCSSEYIEEISNHLNPIRIFWISLEVSLPIFAVSQCVEIMNASVWSVVYWHLTSIHTDLSTPAVAVRVVPSFEQYLHQQV